MKRFVVMEPEGALAPSEDARVVRDGFTWAAVPIPALWLAANRAVLPTLLVLVADIALLVVSASPVLGNAAFWLAILLRVGVALEGPRLVLASLRRRGWREAATLHAGNRTEAEVLYYDSGPRPVRKSINSRWQGLVDLLWQPRSKLGRLVR
ncbi:DUF2628 domain-containing protein [Aureimonas mangrovi]|uniref:DUF2628 domain-containing protein n=1 Tax=Aureimonas mangrovi TaxID=2758041 RepID=UPI00163D40F2|nr:DUF2628 domain-containing protein [Aureimonas mangrovi]